MSARRFVFLLMIAGCVLWGPAAKGDVLYNLSADWSLTANPNGVWSYNQGSTPLPVEQDNWAGVGLDGWTTTTAYVNPPAWGKADAAAYNWEADDVVGHSTNSGNPALATIVWTSPGDGTIDILGQAWDGFHASDRDDNWFLWVGGTKVAEHYSVFGVAKNSAAAQFANNLVPGGSLTGLPVVAGETLTFQIQATSVYGHFVGVDLTVDYSEVPEPATAGAALLGLAGVLAGLRRSFKR